MALDPASAVTVSAPTLAPTLAPGLAGRRIPFERIPVVDLGGLIDGTDERRVAAEVARCCTEIGFFYVRNHGIPASMVDAAFAQTRRFFDLPLERKMALHIKRSRAHRGYFPVFEENTDPKLTADLKEGFDLAREVAESDPRVVAGKPLHGPNVWPDDLPGFRATIDAYYAALMRLAGTLMRAFALGLELPPDWFVDKIDDAMGALRLLHYPPQGGYIKHETLGCGAHSDYGCLTILAQDAVG
ncbi:MAG: isopenicillin N synthase family oxygenase, partial [Alphaproteobacteria bacterium]|nr:isopenicillin N synthase family oxygenase [Alphaproteobacteria bacterium]